MLKELIINKIVIAILTFAHTPQGEVYLIRNVATNNVKIGVTKYANTPNRLKQLQTGSDAKLEVVKVIPTSTKQEAFKLEKQLHSKDHIRGEWFDSRHIDIN